MSIASRLAPTDRRIVALALPALGSLAIEPLYVLTDTAIVGRLGTPQLGGLAVAATVLSFVVAGSNFLTYGTTERVARRIGSGRRDAAGDVAVQALWLSVVVGALATAVVALGARPISAALGADGEVLDHATMYLQISALGIPFVLATLAVQGALRGVSDYTTPLVILLAANAANLVLEVLFVFGFDWGIPGSAWSTILTQVAAAIAFVVRVRPLLATATSRRPVRAELAPLLTAGRHLLLRVGSMLAVFAGATAVAARIDPPTLAAHQVVMSMFMFMALSLDALAVPAQTVVAEELGRGGGATAAHVAHRVARLSLVTGFAVAAVIAVCAPWLPAVFTADAAVADRATVGLWWLAALLVPASVAFAHDGSLIGAGDYRFLGVAALGYFVAVVPLGLVVAWNDGLGINGIWAALAVWMLLRAFVNHRRVRAVLVA